MNVCSLCIEGLIPTSRRPEIYVPPIFILLSTDGSRVHPHVMEYLCVGRPTRLA